MISNALTLVLTVQRVQKIVRAPPLRKSPTSLCADGSERDADTCGCPNVISDVVLAEPEPVVPTVEDLVGISDSEEIIFEEPEQISVEP